MATQVETVALLSALGAILMALSTTLLFFPALRLPWRRRALALVCAVGLLATIPWMIPAQARILRLLVTIYAGVLALKVWDLHVGASRSVRPGWGAFVEFMANPLCIVHRRTGFERPPPPRQDAARFSVCVVVASLGLGVLWMLLRVPWHAAPFLVEHVLKATAFFVGVTALSSAAAAAARLLGVYAPEPMARPLAAPSPAEFWRRYNRWIGRASGKTSSAWSVDGGTPPGLRSRCSSCRPSSTQRRDVDPVLREPPGARATLCRWAPVVALGRLRQVSVKMRTSRTISPGTARLLEGIHGERGRVRRSVAAPRLLAEVGESAEPKALLYLREVLLDRRRNLRDVGAAAALRLLGTLVPDEWAWFDDAMRKGYLAGVAVPYGKWLQLKPLRFTNLVADAPDPRPLVTLGAAHSDGFVREAALELATKHRVLRALPMALLRLRDWVPEVRVAAHRSWAALLPRASDQDLLHLIPLASHLHGLRPTEQLVDGLDLLTRRLLENEAAALELGLAAPGPPTRRFCFRTLLSERARDPADLFHRALGDPDPVIADWSVTDAVAAVPADQRARLLRIAAATHRSRVQLRALVALWEVERGEARDAFEAALVASGGAVREFAQWALGKLGSFDFAAFYRELLPSVTGRGLVAAIVELGRWGSEEDGHGLESFLGPANPPRVSAAALRAVSRLAPEAAREHYGSAISASSRRVARVARDLVLYDSTYPGCARAREWAEAAEHEHTRLYAVTLISRRCSRWPRLAALLGLLVRAEGPVAEVTLRRIGEWIGDAHRGAITPSQEEVREVEWLLSRCADALPEGWAREIRFALH